MMNIGLTELVVIALLALVFVGPERLPEMLRFLGRQYGKLMRASDELRRAFMLEADRSEAESRAKELRRRREEARQRAQEARQRRQEALERGEEAPVEPVPRPVPGSAGAPDITGEEASSTTPAEARAPEAEGAPESAPSAPAEAAANASPSPPEGSGQ